MVTWHLRSKRTKTGKKLRKLRKKRRMDRGTEFLSTRIDERRAKLKRGTGGHKKVKLKSVDTANICDSKTGKVTKSKILSTTENAANPHYVRRNVLTKGAVIKTEAGMARVRSRPGQHGAVSAVLVKEK
jgi:small subunit ribosomal protein S8e